MHRESSGAGMVERCTPRIFPALARLEFFPRFLRARKKCVLKDVWKGVNALSTRPFFFVSTNGNKIFA